MFPIVETTCGRVQGITNRGLHQFKGIPYGAPTGGANRFLPPKRPKPWAGVLDCLGHRSACPQALPDLSNDYINMMLWDLHAGSGGIGEDCLNLNVWTPGLAGRRPVMVLFHGGALRWGSGNGPQFDASRLAQSGDVVVITVNHRLNAFGYLDLAAAGAPDDFRYSSLCGTLDTLAALEWVRDNIEHFGGDPGRVMIFGQSGGGMKVTHLMAMPRAKGLFHRAAVMSGSFLKVGTPEEAAPLADRLLRAVGTTARDVRALQKMPWQRILQAELELNIDGAFRPTVGTDVLPHHPFDPVAPPESAHVPMIISTTRNDFAFMATNYDLDEDGLRAFFDKHFGASGAEVHAAYRSANPAQTPFQVQGQAISDLSVRRGALDQAELKAQQGGAAAYLYQWDWPSPAFDGKFGAIHCMDIEAVLGLHRDPVLGAGAGPGRALSENLSAAFVAFAHTGDPNNGKISHWPAYDTAGRATMVFDRETRVIADYGGALVRLAAKHRSATALDVIDANVRDVCRR